MKTRLFQLLKERKEIHLTELPILMPEIKGKYAIYMPVYKGANPNILWLSDVNQDFIKLFNELVIKDGPIKWKPQNIMFLLFDGVPIYTNIKTATPSLAKGKRECWLPVTISLNKD